MLVVKRNTCIMFIIAGETSLVVAKLGNVTEIFLNYDFFITFPYSNGLWEVSNSSLSNVVLGSMVPISAML